MITEQYLKLTKNQINNAMQCFAIIDENETKQKLATEWYKYGNIVIEKWINLDNYYYSTAISIISRWV